MLTENQLLSTPEVDRLLTLVEEATRATSESPRRFLEPARGTLDRAKARRHHLIFGRRGSGKTSLLRKAQADLTLKRAPTAFVDLETFKGHTYPDVLLSVLIETLTAFDQWLQSAGITPATKRTFWKRLFGAKPVHPRLNRQSVDALRNSLTNEIKALRTLLLSEDDVPIVSTTTDEQSTSRSSSASVSLGVPGQASAKLGTSAGAAQRSGREIIEQGKRDKLNILHRQIIDFQKLIDQIVQVSNSDGYIFLDDLYHIRRTDQALVLDYFHRILKGRSAWLKIGTIRHRTEWYHHGDPPTGLKLGDDCDDIDLDITLEKYELARKFLLQILDQLMVDAGLDNHRTLLADGGIQRLVLASGGVARDFLTIFRRAVDVARERGETHRGELVNAEDVNVAAGEHDIAKRDELKRDTHGEERGELEKALRRLQEFCLNNRVNCLLVERDRESSGNHLIGELVDLRFLHVVASRTTVRDQPGKLYTAYMLDISQYTGERRRREMEIIEFWSGSKLDRIRRSKYVLHPEILVT